MRREDLNGNELSVRCGVMLQGTTMSFVLIDLAGKSPHRRTGLTGVGTAWNIVSYSCFVSVSSLVGCEVNKINNTTELLI